MDEVEHAELSTTTLGRGQPANGVSPIFSLKENHLAHRRVAQSSLVARCCPPRSPLIIPIFPTAGCKIGGQVKRGVGAVRRRRRGGRRQRSAGLEYVCGIQRGMAWWEV